MKSPIWIVAGFVMCLIIVFGKDNVVQASVSPAHSESQSIADAVADDEEFEEAADPARYRKHLEDAVDLAAGEIEWTFVDGVKVYHKVGDTSKVYTGWLTETIGDAKFVQLFQVADGKGNGPFVQYFADGKKRISTQCVDNLLQGLWRQWNKDGKLIKERRFKDGRPVRGR